eukprot:m.43903 g.43903  ORF g.43903 m.43903 type:complete len:375 (-) comp10571_c0_seq1:121-1245(-)
MQSFSHIVVYVFFPLVKVSMRFIFLFLNEVLFPLFPPPLSPSLFSCISIDREKEEEIEIEEGIDSDSVVYFASCRFDENAFGNTLEDVIGLECKRIALSMGYKKDVDVELYVTTPSRFPMKPPAQDAISVDITDMETTIPMLHKHGIVIAKNAIPLVQITRCLEEANEHISVADENLLAKGVKIGKEDFRFKEMSSRENHRFDLLVPKERFVGINTLAKEGAWVPLMKSMLGDDVTCDVSLVYSRPGAREQTWHADGPHLGKTADWTGEGEDKPFAVCVFMPLITLNKTVGFTQFWPGSHKYDELIGFGAVCPLLECELDAIVDVGNAVVYDYRLIHRGMPNMSSGTERPLIQFLYHVPQYVENRNYGKESLFG